MQIRVVFQPKSQLRNKIKNTYIDLYRKYKRQNPADKTYTRTKLKQNISSALSTGRICVDESLLRQTKYNPWKQHGWMEIPPHSHWYFAVKKVIDKRGMVLLEIQDCVYEGYYHNDTMNTQPYDESRHISKSQLRKIIRESIRKYLNIV